MLINYQDQGFGEVFIFVKKLRDSPYNSIVSTPVKAIVCIFFILIVQAAFGQYTVIFDGTFRDIESGESLPDLPVKLINLWTNDTTLSMTNDSGYFEFASSHSHAVKDSMKLGLVLLFDDLNYRSPLKCGYYPTRRKWELDSIKFGHRIHTNFSLASYNCCSELPLPRIFYRKREVTSIEDVPGALDSLKVLATIMAENPYIVVEIASHCNGVNDPKQDSIYAQQIGNSVAAGLMNLGVADERMVVKSYGSDRPLYFEQGSSAPNDSNLVHLSARNNRVYFKVLSYDYRVENAIPENR